MQTTVHPPNKWIVVAIAVGGGGVVGLFFGLALHANSAPQRATPECTAYRAQLATGKSLTPDEQVRFLACIQ